MSFFKMSVLLVLSCFSSFVLEAVTPDSTQQTIDFLFKPYSGERPGASFVVVKDGEMVRSGAYGYADIEKKILATTKTNYRLASVSKQYTAMAIMMLVRRGLLDFETTLVDLFPDFPSYGKAVTVRHLLTHRSGLIDYGHFLAEGRTEPLLNQEMMDSLKRTDATYFPPGSQFRYSNTAYTVLPLIVEKLTGMTYPKFMEKEIFEPLGMTDARIYVAGDSIPQRAYGYFVGDDQVLPSDQSLTSAIQGDGVVYASVEDFVKWDQALYTDRLVPKKELQDAFQAWGAKGKSDGEGYGYGWFVRFFKGIKILDHTGGTSGFTTYVLRIPSRKLSIAIYTNRRERDSKIRSIMRALVSLHSEGEFPMPMEIPFQQKLIKSNVTEAVQTFHSLRRDTLKYAISEAGMYDIGALLLQHGAKDQALDLYRKVLQASVGAFGEAEMNNIGYRILNGGLTELAIEAFQLNVEVFPESFNAYDSLGEAYMVAGKKELAIRNYEKSLELNPENLNGREMLKRLKE